MCKFEQTSLQNQSWDFITSTHRLSSLYLLKQQTHRALQIQALKNPLPIQLTLETKEFKKNLHCTILQHFE